MEFEIIQDKKKPKKISDLEKGELFVFEGFPDVVYLRSDQKKQDYGYFTVIKLSNGDVTYTSDMCVRRVKPVTPVQLQIVD
jgi:hypothetical protein